MKPAQPTELTFWDHLDELRRTIIHIACAVIVLMLLAFCFKEELFGLILAPKERDFCTYRLFAWLGEVLHISGLETETLPVKLINTQLSGQFLTHMSVSFYAGMPAGLPLTFSTSFFVLFLRHSIRRKRNIPAGWSSGATCCS